MAEARRRSRRGRVSGARRARRCCGAAGRRCLTTVGRDRQGAAKTEESAVQQTRRNATPFPDVSPAARQHPPRQQKGHRRSKANTTEGPQQQKGLRRRCVAAKRGGEGHSNKIDTAKPNTATAERPQQLGHGGKKKRPIVYGRPREFVSKTVGWDGTSPRPAPERRNQRGAWSERHQEPADSQRTSS